MAPSTLSALRVFGYHGTSVTAAERIMSSGFQPSTKEWDWLGDGAYFFQDAPMRAWEWARDRHRAEPAVLCAEIILERCIDLFDIPWNEVIIEAHEFFRAEEVRQGRVPLNQSPEKGNRRLDRSVINYEIDQLVRSGEWWEECEAPSLKASHCTPLLLCMTARMCKSPSEISR